MKDSFSQGKSSFLYFYHDRPFIRHAENRIMLDHVLLEPLNTVQIFLFGICLSVCLLKFLALTRCKVALKYANKWEASNYVLVRTLKIWLSVLFVNMITCPLVNLSFFCNFHFFYVPLYGSTFLLNYMKEEKNTSEHNRTDRGRRISNWTTKSITILTKLLLQLLDRLRVWNLKVQYCLSINVTVFISDQEMGCCKNFELLDEDKKKLGILSQINFSEQSYSMWALTHWLVQCTRLADVTASDKITKVFKILWRVLERLKNLFCGILKKAKT